MNVDPFDGWNRRFRGVVGLVLVCVVAIGCDVAGRVDAGSIEDGAVGEAGSLSFVAVGDWGRDGRYGQDEVAAQMGRAAASLDARMVVTTGDNFYPDGVDAVTDPQFDTSFEYIYTAASLQIPWHPVLGNHDYEGDVQAQLDYSRLNERWTMPSRYYAVTYGVDGDTEAVFVFLDTTPMAADGASDGGVRRQLAWLDSTLTASRAAWRVVVAHHPLYSNGKKHGHAERLIAMLEPLLERHGVQVYLSGHAHSLQHLQPGGTVAYFISGAGSEVRPVDGGPPAVFTAAVSGFMTGSLTADELRVRFIDDRGRLLYTTVVAREPAAAVP